MQSLKSKKLYWLAWITDTEPLEKPHCIPLGFPTSHSDVNLLQILYQLVRAMWMPQICCSLSSSTRYLSLGQWINIPTWVSQPWTDSLRNAHSHHDSSTIQLENQFWNQSRFPRAFLSRPRSAWGEWSSFDRIDNVWTHQSYRRWEVGSWLWTDTFRLLQGRGYLDISPSKKSWKNARRAKGMKTCCEQLTAPRLSATKWKWGDRKSWLAMKSHGLGSKSWWLLGHQWTKNPKPQKPQHHPPLKKPAVYRKILSH